MLGLFKPKTREREIFKYHDGERERAADPVAIMRAMANHPTLDLQQNVQEMQAEDLKVQTSATVVAVNATREIFGVKPWSEENPDGLTEMETLDLLAEFVNYSAELKKNGSGRRI
jgi:hypothetical protein